MKKLFWSKAPKSSKMFFLKGWEDYSVRKVFAHKPKEPSSSPSVYIKEVCTVILEEVEQEAPWSSVSNQASLAKSVDSVCIERPCLRLRSEQQDVSVGQRACLRSLAAWHRSPEPVLEESHAVVYVCDPSTPVGSLKAETEKAD